MIFYPRCHAQIEVVFDGRGGPDTAPFTVDATPIDATVHRNGYHEADTWSLSFNARSLPFDPDLIRAAAVSIFMFAADGLDDRREPAVPANFMILGLCDDAGLELGRDGQVFRMDGRDATALLLDREWDPKEKVQVGRPLSVVVQQMADRVLPAGSRLRFDVVFESVDERGLPTPQPIVGRSRRGKNRGLNVDAGKSYWDAIYELCLSHGFIVFVRDTQIVITDPQTQTTIPRAGTPHVAYGKNLDSLSVQRRFGKERVPQIAFNTHDPRTGRRIKVLYPKKHDTPKTGVGTLKDEILQLPAPDGVYDEGTLRRLARVHYETIARSESSYRFTTKFLRDIEGNDLFRLDAGKPVHIHFDPFNAEQMRALSSGQRVEHLLAMGYSPRLSAFLANHFDRLEQFTQPYYVKSAEFVWSNTSGIQITCEAANYSYEPREIREAA